MIYGALRRILFLVPPERIHTVVFACLRLVTATALARRVLGKWLAPHDPVLESTVFGVKFPGPVGLAAGFDKDGTGLNTWGAMGFGYAEIGTVTAHAQPGNPRRGCSASPTTERCSIGWASTTTVPASWRCD